MSIGTICIFVMMAVRLIVGACAHGRYERHNFFTDDLLDVVCLIGIMALAGWIR